MTTLNTLPGCGDGFRGSRSRIQRNRRRPAFAFGSERVNCGTRETLRCSVADLFKKFSGSVQSSYRSSGLLWGVAKIIGSEA